MNEKNVEEKGAISALESMLDRYYISTPSGKKEKLMSELEELTSKASQDSAEKSYLALLLSEAQQIASNEWFKNVYSQSSKLKDFYTSYKKLKGSP